MNNFFIVNDDALLWLLIVILVMSSRIRDYIFQRLSIDRTVVANKRSNFLFCKMKNGVTVK